MRQSKMLAVSSLALLVAACGGGSNDDTANKNTNTLPVVVTTKDVAIQFAAQANGADVKCGAVNSINNIGTSNKTVEIRDLRFYVAEVKLINDKNEAVAVVLKESPENVNQRYGVTLLDFEDATGVCAEVGTKDTYTTIQGTIPQGNYTGIQFILGVPDTGVDSTGKTIALSHTETTSMLAPLDVAAMAWSWQGGRKFVKVEVNPVGGVFNQKGTADTSDDANEKVWTVHLGATGCTDKGATESPLTRYECSNPNLTTIKLPTFDYTKQKVVLDIPALFMGSEVSLNKVGPLGCMSGKTDTECGAVFDALGINLETGKTSTTKAQSIFKVVNK